MAEILLPHVIVYDLERPASVSDVVSALLGAEQLLRETIPLLEGCVNGLTIERIAISVRHLSQGSPLRAAFYVAIVFTFQKDLEKAVPAIAEQILGTHVPADYNTILVLAFCLLLFYGADSIYSQVSKGAHSRRIRQHLDSVTKELAGECRISEERIKKILETKYGKSRLRILAQSAISFFKPSKPQDNAPVMISGRKIDRETIKEVPSEAEIESAEVPEVARPYKDVLIELHAQDVDKHGWAGIVPEISPRRLRIELEQPIKLEDIYTKQKIRADIMLLSRKHADGSYRPSAVHVLDIKEVDPRPGGRG